MAKKEETVEDFNNGLLKKIGKLEEEIKELKKTFKAETLKPQASLQECLAMSRKSSKPKVVEDKVKPKTNSL